MKSVEIGFAGGKVARVDMAMNQPRDKGGKFAETAGGGGTPSGFGTAVEPGTQRRRERPAAPTGAQRRQPTAPKTAAEEELLKAQSAEAVAGMRASEASRRGSPWRHLGRELQKEHAAAKDRLKQAEAAVGAAS